MAPETPQADVEAMFMGALREAQEPKPRPKQNKRLTRVVQAIAWELRNLPPLAARKILWPIIRPKSRITSRAAERILLGLRRRRQLKKLRRQMARASKQRNR